MPKHACGFARRIATAIPGVEREARRLHEIELAGTSAETPLIAMLGLVLFLAAVFLVVAGLSLAADWLDT